MYNKNMFKAELVKRGITQRALANTIKMDVSVLNRKINNGHWSIKDLPMILKALNVKDEEKFIFDIFLSKNSSET